MGQSFRGHAVTGGVTRNVAASQRQADCRHLHVIGLALRRGVVGAQAGTSTITASQTGLNMAYPFSQKSWSRRHQRRAVDRAGVRPTWARHRATSPQEASQNAQSARGKPMEISGVLGTTACHGHGTGDCLVELPNLPGPTPWPSLKGKTTAPVVFSFYGEGRNASTCNASINRVIVRFRSLSERRNSSILLIECSTVV